jgi:hypothetical protein
VLKKRLCLSGGVRVPTLRRHDALVIATAHCPLARPPPATTVRSRPARCPSSGDTRIRTCRDGRSVASFPAPLDRDDQETSGGKRPVELARAIYDVLRVHGRQAVVPAQRIEDPLAFYVFGCCIYLVPSVNLFFFTVESENGT